jgi:signal transduction histidine kinase
VEYLQRVSRMRHIARDNWFELLIGALGVVAMIELIVGRNSPGAPSTSLRYAVPVVGLLVAPLFARRRFPFAAPAAYWVAASAISFFDGVLIPFMVSLFPIGLVAAFLLGNSRDAHRAWAGLAIVLGGITTVVYNIPGHLTAELIVIPVDFGIAWAAGFTLRERAEKAEAAETRAIQAERDRETATRIAVAEERARIARELHDVVAHSVSVMVVQSGAARRVLDDDPDQAMEALGEVERSGRQALSELRRLLGLMRDGDDGAAAREPQPTLAGIDDLIRRARDAGLPTELRHEGEPFALPMGCDLAAYRVVQEALTNSLKHAGAGAHAKVLLRWTEKELELDITDTGNGLAAAGPDLDGPLGQGLVGMRERVALCGGDMQAGPRWNGGFRVRATIPRHREAA